jgi:hypothetical protein
MVAINDISKKMGERIADLVLKSMGQVPERKKDGDAERRHLIPRNEPKWPPDEWSRVIRKAYFVIQDPILIRQSHKLNVTTQDLPPNTDEFLFETDLGGIFPRFCRHCCSSNGYRLILDG